ncbi:adenine methyltransferase [Devosia sp. H5989]|nr:adenine methyltransferase [Devosia sp. H5989]
MGYWEANGASNDWYTPRHVFDALGAEFDMDVAAPEHGSGTFVPARQFIHQDSLSTTWFGFIWMNPPFGGRNGLTPWLDRFIEHGNGIALTPDRTSAPWWQAAAPKVDAVLFVSGKIKFVRPDGSSGDSPSNGTTLFGIGRCAVEALERAEQHGLGYLAHRRVAA